MAYHWARSLDGSQPHRWPERWWPLAASAPHTGLPHRAIRGHDRLVANLPATLVRGKRGKERGCLDRSRRRGVPRLATVGSAGGGCPST